MSVETSNAVFISYRREKAQFLAIVLHQSLESLEVNAFLDMESIGAGEFETIILNQIAARPYFLLVLTPGTLERCVDPGDWLRREIEQALNTGRVVVPVFTSDFEINDLVQFLPESGLKVAGFHGHVLPANAFKTSVEVLVDKFLLPRRVTSVVLPADEQKVVDRLNSEARAVQPVTEEELSRKEAEREREAREAAAREREAREEAEREREVAAARKRRRRLMLLGAAAAAVLVVVVAAGIVAGMLDDDSGDDFGESVVEIDVPGTVEWTDTGVVLAVGDSIVIDATGTVHHAAEDPSTGVGPDGASDDEVGDIRLNEVGTSLYVKPPGHGGLVGRVGEDGAEVGVGSHFEADNLTTAGTLYLGINDMGVENNDGSFQATITVTR